MSNCPKGHASASLDYCDECGSPMTASPIIMQRPPTRANEEACPDCKTIRESGARFCEVCQYDFTSATPSTVSDSKIIRSDALARAALQAQAIPHPAPQLAQLPAEMNAATLEVPLLARVISDQSFCPDDAARQSYPPTPIPEHVFHLDLDENLIGRESASKNAKPEIPLIDPGASRRHAKLIRQNGSFHLLELGSSNGTLLDGKPAEPGRPMPIQAGSIIRIGMWTQISIEERTRHAS